jgi:hypothetical protein
MFHLVRALLVSLATLVACNPKTPNQNDYAVASTPYSTAIDVTFTEIGPSDVIPNALILQTQCATVCVDSSVAGNIQEYVKTAHAMKDATDQSVQILNPVKRDHVKDVADFMDIVSILKSSYRDKGGSAAWSTKAVAALQKFVAANPTVVILSFTMVNTETKAKWTYVAVYVPGPDQGVDKVHLVMHIMSTGTRSPTDK